MDGIYIITVVVAALLVAGAIIVMTRSLARRTSPTSYPLSSVRELVRRMRAARTTAEAEPFSPAPSESEKEIRAGLEAQPKTAPPELDSSPHWNEKPDTALPEAGQPSGIEEEETVEGLEEREHPLQKDDSLNAFRVEMVEDTGLSRLAESLEDVDIHNLLRVVKDVSREIGADRKQTTDV